MCRELAQIWFGGRIVVLGTVVVLTMQSAYTDNTVGMLQHALTVQSYTDFAVYMC